MRFFTVALMVVLVAYSSCDEPVYANGGGLGLRARLRARMQVKQVQQVQYAQPVQVKQVKQVRQQVIIKPAPVLTNPYPYQQQSFQYQSFKQQLFQPYPAVIQPAQAFLKMSYADQALPFKQQQQFQYQQQSFKQQSFQQPYYQLPSQGAYCP